MIESSEGIVGEMKIRPYQKDGIAVLLDFTKSHCSGIVGNLQNDSLKSLSSLLEMATGSGKTFTVGTYLDHIIKLRDRYNSRSNTTDFQRLNILTLTNRIDGLEQFRNDLIYGSEGEKSKAPFLSSPILMNMRQKTFHSKADNLDEVDKEYWYNDSEDDVVIPEGDSGLEDTLFFSTFQTAILKGLSDKLPYVDLVIIDEAHNVRGGAYLDLIYELSNCGREGHSPIIIPVTATPSNLTKETFGNPRFTFGVAEYLASPYSPSVDYKLITSAGASVEDLNKIKGLVEQAKESDSRLEKKRIISEIEELFQEIMAVYPSLEDRITDLLDKRIGRQPGPTVVYANSIEEANQIAIEVNKQLGEDLALPYHSGNDKGTTVDWSKERKNSLERFTSPLDEVKIIVAVGKLNESIDVPSVENVVFWQTTNIERIFLQQFGRGLRGTGTTKYYDYVGGIKNFSWIGNVYDEYKTYRLMDGLGEEIDRNSNFNVSGGNISSEEHGIDINDLLFDFVDIQNEVGTEALTSQEIEDHFFNYVEGDKEASYETLMEFGVLDIKNIEIGGRRIANISTISRWTNPNNSHVHNVQGFREYISWLFDEKLKILTLNDIRNYFFNYVDGNKDSSFETLTKLKTEDIKKITIQGKGVKAIESITGWENSNNSNVTTPQGFYEFISWLFNKELEALDRQGVENYFFNYVEGDKEGSYELLINIKTEEFLSLNIDGKRMSKISRVCGWDNPNAYNVTTIKGFKEFVNWLFGKEPKVQSVILNADNIKSYFLNYAGDDREESYTALMNLGHKEIRGVKFQGNGLKALSRICGWSDPDGLYVTTMKGFHNYIGWLFSKNVENVDRTTIEEYFFKYAGDDKEKSYTALMSLRQEDLINIEVSDCKIYKIGGICGWNNSNNSNINTVKGFREFVSWLFDRKQSVLDLTGIKDYFLNYTEGNIEKSYVNFMMYKRTDILEINIQGKKIISIGKISGWENPDQLDISTPKGFRVFISWIFEKI